ncbi:MAG: hypothetical protein H5T24_08430 [Bacteroidales bacterium]|nr:hypothetical protein [Bacteroidales bacterium]
MKKIMHILFLSCQKATELIEKKFHFKLSLSERIQLKIHKMMCEACTKYEKQSSILDKGISQALKNNYSDIDLENLKLMIHKKIEQSK